MPGSCRGLGSSVDETSSEDRSGFLFGGLVGSLHAPLRLMVAGAACKQTGRSRVGRVQAQQPHHQARMKRWRCAFSSGSVRHAAATGRRRPWPAVAFEKTSVTRSNQSLCVGVLASDQILNDRCIKRQTISPGFPAFQKLKEEIDLRDTHLDDGTACGTMKQGCTSGVGRRQLFVAGGHWGLHSDTTAEMTILSHLNKQ